MSKHRLLLTSLLCLAILGGGFGSAAQEEPAAEPRTIVSLAATFAGANLISMPDSGTGISISGGSYTEAGEPMPSCTGGVMGTYGSWFVLYHPGGTLDINTAASGGTNFDSIIQVFAYDTMDITDLLEVACDNNSGGGSGGNDARVNQVMASAAYFVRISCGNCPNPIGTSLSLSVSFTPPPGTTPASDIINNLAPITFNKTVRVDNIGFATVAGSENSTLGCPMYHTVWHRFFAPRSGYYTFSAYGSRIIRPYETQDTKLAVYSSSGGPVFANLTELGCNDDYYGSLYSTLAGIYTTAGTEVYVRVGSFGDANMLAGSHYRIRVSPDYMENLGTNGAFGSGMTGWTLSGTTPGDGLFNDAGDNVVRLFGAVGKNSKLKQSVNTASLLLTEVEDGSAFRMYANYSTAGTVSSKGKLVLKVLYSDGTPPTVSATRTMRITSGYVGISLVAPVTSKNVSKVIMMAKNSSSSGALLFDDITVNYMGNPARDAKQNGVLPLPAAPDAPKFRGSN